MLLVLSELQSWIRSAYLEPSLCLREGGQRPACAHVCAVTAKTVGCVPEAIENMSAYLLHTSTFVYLCFSRAASLQFHGSMLLHLQNHTISAFANACYCSGIFDWPSKIPQSLDAEGSLGGLPKLNRGTHPVQFKHKTAT